MVFFVHPVQIILEWKAMKIVIVRDVKLRRRGGENRFGDGFLPALQFGIMSDNMWLTNGGKLS